MLNSVNRVVKKDSKTLIIITASLLVFVVAALVIYTKIKDNYLGQDNNSSQENRDDLSSYENDLLSDFPIYPGATEESSYTTEGDNKATSIVWKTDDSISEVSYFYNKELEMGGWEITSIIENENSTTLSFTRGESYGFVGIGKGEGDITIISVTIGERVE